MPHVGNRHSEAELVRLVCRIIAAGHGPGAWNYGISFFKIALDCLDEDERQRSRNVSIAFKAAELDEKGWNRWLASFDEPAAHKKVTHHG